MTPACPTFDWTPWGNCLLIRGATGKMNATIMPTESTNAQICLVDGLKAALTTKPRTERPVRAWLKKHPLVISHVVRGHPGKVVAEFPFGSDYRADFVTLRTYSGGCDINFVELEPPGVPLFTKMGRMAEHLNEAFEQVEQWRRFVEKHGQFVLEDLSKFFKKKELVFGARDSEPTDECGRHIFDHRCWAKWYYNIVIGRRQSLNDDQAFKKAAFRHIDVMTFDRLLETAAKLDNYKAEQFEAQTLHSAANAKQNSDASLTLNPSK